MRSMTDKSIELSRGVVRAPAYGESKGAVGKESTPRLHATSVYAKAGVSGRAEFVAEIFQPLLMTMPERPQQGNKTPAVATESL